jgi:hypothetical protein
VSSDHSQSSIDNASSYSSSGIGSGSDSRRVEHVDGDVSSGVYNPDSDAWDGERSAG